MRSLGQWNAYVEAGQSKEERRARLAEVPEPMRAQVESHVRTVYALKSRARAPHLPME